METRDGSGIRCSEHPDAPHGFMRDASHSAGRYVCECESWEPPKNKPMTRDEWKEWLAKSWDEAQARAKHMTMIKTWQERCEEHPDHEGIVTEQAKGEEQVDREAIEEAIEVLEDAGADMLMETGDKNYYIEAIAVLRQALVDADDTSQERVDEIVKALVLADALEELDVQFSHTGLCGEAADELRRLHVWEKAYEAVCDERDAIIRDSDKAHALLRWVEKEMRYAGWDIRLNDQHGRTDVYEAIKEFLA